MLTEIGSGGQSGVDQAALRAARACGIPTGGIAPKGWETEDGPAPWLVGYGLIEGGGGYALRTRENVRRYGGVLILSRSFPRELTGGTLLTLRIAHELDRPFRNIHLGVAGSALPMVRGWLVGADAPTTLLVAGPRESKQPGIGEEAERFLTELFRSLRGEKT